IKLTHYPKSGQRMATSGVHNGSKTLAKSPSMHAEGTTMDWKLELVAIPVTDVDRAKAFYADQVGFVADHDHTVSDEMRFVQLTPPGSACSIALGKGLTTAAPGSVQGMQLVVA